MVSIGGTCNENPIAVENCNLAGEPNMRGETLSFVDREPHYTEVGCNYQRKR